jgi:hypothetical protein
MSTIIKSKYSTTASSTPTTLAVGELAFNITDKKGWIGNANTAAVQILGPGAGGVDTISFGSTGLTPSSATGGAVVVAGTVNVSHGGTGNTATPTAGGMVYGDGSKMATTSAGNSGQILTSQGSSAPIWANIGVGGFSNGVVFTSSGTFTVPSTGKFKVTVIGGGADGSTYGSTYGGNGGNGSYTAVKWLTGLTPGNTCTATVGAGSGGISSFSGSGFSTISADYTGATSADLTVQGGIGAIGYGSGGLLLGGMGGSTPLGGSGYGGRNTVNAGNGSGYGSGGGGAGNVASPGLGAQGIIIIEY